MESNYSLKNSDRSCYLFYSKNSQAHSIFNESPDKNLNSSKVSYGIHSNNNNLNKFLTNNNEEIDFEKKFENIIFSSGASKLNKIDT